MPSATTTEKCIRYLNMNNIENFVDDKSIKLVEELKNDWPRLAETVFGLNLDDDQKAILSSVQNDRRTIVRSGHARGKDFTSAVAACCFLYTKAPSKVILTAPTQRQVEKIMMAEVKTIIRKANQRMKMFGWSMGGTIGSTRITFPNLRDDWYLEGFKAEDKATESWTGFHSSNILVVVTEASGIQDETFQAIEGILTGDCARLLLVGNPNRTSGEFFNAFRAGRYNRFKLSCMNAPNVINKKNLIPGQVDWQWVDDHVAKPGWTQPIDKKFADPIKGDFEWDGRWYRPSDPFRVKVQGEFPEQSEDSLIPLSWIEQAVKRWHEQRHLFDPLVDEIRYGHLKKPGRTSGLVDEHGNRIQYRLGADIAGMGADTTVFCHRYDHWVGELETYAKQHHMVTAGRIITRLKMASRHGGGAAYVDSIGEGAGVYSRVEEKLKSEILPDIEMRGLDPVKVVSVKFSESAKHYRDITEVRQFANMRAYCYWSIRDHLDPNIDGPRLCLPPHEDLHFDLTELRWKIRSDGRIIIEPKEDFKKRVGRSTDDGDALAVTYSPKDGDEIGSIDDTMEGMGIF